MTRRYGRRKRGERLVCKVPHGHWKTSTSIAALRHDRVTAPLLLEGPMMAQLQGPRRTDTRADPQVWRHCVMDNVSVHKVSAVFVTPAEQDQALALRNSEDRG